MEKRYRNKNKYRNIWRKMPLLCLILITTAVMSIIGIIGVRGFLSDYSVIDFRKNPYYTATIFGIKEYLNGDEDLVVPSSMVKHTTSAPTNSADTDDKKSSDVPDSTDHPDASQDTTGDASSENVEQAPSETTETTAERLTIPDGVNNAVVTAADYGVVDRSLMVDDGYVFTTDTDGLFAPNGTYRYLEPAADDSYFNDALFIGDSRTVGLMYWGGLETCTNFFCKESMSIFNVTKKDLDYQGWNGESGTTNLDTLLQDHTYGKIYLCLGINEMNRFVLDYYNEYRAVVQHIRELQPNAIIYIEGNMHVAGPLSFTDSIFNNTNLVQRNAAIASLANGRDIFYIDMNSVFTDGDGNLIAEYTNDDIHVKAAYYPIWADFLRQNTIDVTKEPQ